MIDYDFSFDDVIDFWMTFFPEIEQREEFEKLLENSSGSNLYYLKDNYYSNLNYYSGDLNTILENKKCVSTQFEELFTELEKTHRWTNFFKPIIIHYCTKLNQYLNETKIVESKDIFIKDIIDYTIIGLYAMSYKVLVLETNIARLEGKLHGDTSVEKAEYFSRVLLKDNDYIKSLYEDYPELTRLMCLKVKNIFNYAIEVISNTEKEYKCLALQLNSGEDLGYICKMVMGEGDSHNNGKTVVKLFFSSGLKLVYKPRKLQIEIGYYNFIDWYNKQTTNSSAALLAPKVHTIKDAGWMEYIEHIGCTNSEGIKQFYFRTGQLLALLYILNAKDFHYENLIACGNQPVLIDLETLFHADLICTEINNVNAVKQGCQVVYNSVKGIALLPTQIVNQKNSKVLEVGGLSKTESQSSPFKSSFIKDYDTAEIRIVTDYGLIDSKNNNPILDGVAIDSTEYLLEIKEGFTYTYNFVKGNKSLFKNKIEEIFNNSLGRFVFRPTNLYSQLIGTSFHPDLLRNTNDRNIYLHRVGLIAEKGQYDITNKEISQMLNGDVPYFTAYFNGNSILDGEENVLIPLPGQSAASSIYQKIDLLNYNDLRQQLYIINHSYSNHSGSNNLCTTKVSFINSSEKYNISYKNLIDAAKEIGDFILTSSITGNENGIVDRTWIGQTELIKDYFEITCVGNDIYSGNSGIALFLALLGEVTGEEEYKRAALEAITTVVNDIERITDYNTIKIGMFTGVSGWLYSIFHIGRILKNHELIDFVYKKLYLIGEMITPEQNYDAVSGVSGALGVLISIYENTTDITLKGILLATCDRLYEVIKGKSIALEEGDQITWGEEGFVGFSHGNAGVISQLIKLYSITKNNDIMDIIRKSLNYENKMYHKKYKNWCKQLNDKVYYYKWCHGAPGILLSRLLLYKYGYINENIVSDISVAIEGMQKNGFGSDYCLCHGDMGNLLILNYASQILEDDILRKSCMVTAESLINNYFANSWKDEGLKQTENMGMMIGLSGVGYGLLQLCKPHIIPNILLIE